MLTVVGGLHADAGLSHINENDGTLFADQVGPNHATQYFRSSHVCGDEGDKLALVQLRRVRSCSSTVACILVPVIHS